MIVAIEGVSRSVHRLSEEFAAVQLHFQWFGQSKTLNRDQKNAAADVFSAQGSSLSASKRLVNSKLDCWKQINDIKREARECWEKNTLPYPGDATRLIRISDIASFEAAMESYSRRLEEAVVVLNEHRELIVNDAIERLGALVGSHDYPLTFDGLFGVNWEYPNMTPPGYLRMVDPGLYESRVRRIQERIEEAAEMAEEAFFTQFHDMVDRLKNQLEPDENGQPRRFYESAVTNLQEFFQRFRHLNVGSSEELERAVEDLEKVLGNRSAGDVRNRRSIRDDVRSTLNDMSGRLESMIESVPRRSFD